jgi:NNP family nitrate/nitrite transporter-like MFS transporter
MSTLITRWEPDNRAFWDLEGARIARRNLALSVPPLVLAFAVWSLWGAAVVYLPQAGYAFTTDQLFWLAALPALAGATLRIVYAFMVPIFGGRRWTVISTALLVIPTAGFGLAVQSPDTGFTTFALLALACGLGGGHFASRMANVSFFFPRSQQGIALGLSAGLGNLGVSLAQFVMPLAVTGALFGGLAGEPRAWDRAGEAHSLWLQNAGFVWVPFIAVAAVAAWFGMNDLAPVRASLGAQTVIFRRRDAWRLSWLYLGTFGSFMGYAAGLPLLIASQFPQVNPLNYVWLGPLVGALVRPVGGWLADELGAARVTFWNFVVMAMATLGVLVFLPASPGNEEGFHGFLAMFMVLFVAAGIGNGATFSLIPRVFAALHRRPAPDPDDAREAPVASREAAAVLGLASAVGAYGGFFIPKSYGTAIALTGDPAAALWMFLVFYVTCIAIAGGYLLRDRHAVPSEWS